MPPPPRIADVPAEALLLAGGVRAILLQLANPAVGHGVARHSDFVERPLDRLHGTLTYLYVVAYGTPDEVAAVARRVGHAHTPVRSSPEAPVGYDARDETLQLWVAATLYESAMRIHQLVFDELTAADVQTLLDQGAAVATTLGVPRTLWPATTTDFAAYWSRCERDLRVDDAARGVADALLHPRSVPWWFGLALPSVRVMTAGLLSPELRAGYGLPFDERRYERLVRILRLVYPRLPRALRHWPKRHYLRRFRTGRRA